jgi:hypothetical protein
MRLTVFYSIVFGAGAVLLMAANVGVLLLHMGDRTKHPPLDSLVKWAWGTSVVSLVLTMLAPVPLVLAIASLRKATQEGEAQPSRRPALMALVNSTWGLVGFVGLTAVILSEALVL